MSTTSNEARFWRDTVLSTVNPGWRLSLGDAARSGRPEFAQLTAAIYLVDTSSDWRLAGMTEPSDMLAIEQRIRSGEIDGKRIADAAGWCVLDNSRPGTREHDRDEAANAEFAIKLAVGALVQTRCYELAKAGPCGLSGHWMYLVYRMRDGSSVARPAMAPVRATPFSLMEPSMLEASIARIVHADTSAAAHTSSIARRLHESGGAILAGDAAQDGQTAVRPRPDR